MPPLQLDCLGEQLASLQLRNARSGHSFSESGRCGTEEGPAFRSGIQALARPPMVQRRLAPSFQTKPPDPSDVSALRMPAASELEDDIEGPVVAAFCRSRYSSA